MEKKTPAQLQTQAAGLPRAEAQKADRLSSVASLALEFRTASGSNQQLQELYEMGFYR